MDFSKGLLVLSCRLTRWWRRLLSQSLVLSLILRLIFRGYEVSEVPAPYWILDFPLELYAFVSAVSVVPMEFTIFGVVPCGGILLHLSWPPQELFVSYFAQDL